MAKRHDTLTLNFKRELMDASRIYYAKYKTSVGVTILPLKAYLKSFHLSLLSEATAYTFSLSFLSC